MQRGPLVQVVALAVAGTAVGTVIVLNVPWFPEEASSQARGVDDLFRGLAVASVFIFSVVMSILLVSVVHFRRRSGELRDGPPIHGHAGLEIAWTVVPAAIVTAAAISSALVLAHNEQKKAHEQLVVITGQQFTWTFDYPGLGVTKAGELHLVKGRSYFFKIRTLDVIHSFWVPELRLKQDAVPGLTTKLRVTPTRIGHYTVVCAELCGLGHATMRSPLIVEDRAAFSRWLANQRSMAARRAS